MGSVRQGPPSTSASPGRPCPGAVPPPIAPAAWPPPPPLGGDLSASAPGPPLTQVAAPQPGRVLQPEGPFPHVPQQVWAAATSRHGSAGPGEERRPPRGGGERGEGTRGLTPEPHQHHPRAGPRGSSELDGGGSGSAFAPEARPHPGLSSPHTLLLKTTQNIQRSATVPSLSTPSYRRRWRRRRRPRLLPLLILDTLPFKPFSRDNDHPGDWGRCVPGLPLP